MTVTPFSAATLDDLLHDVYYALLKSGTPVRSSHGDNVELSPAILELTNPLARLSRSETRGKIFSCLGELCWYLSGDDSLEMIKYYIREYEREAVNGKILGAYGPRLFGSPPHNQFHTVLELLKVRPYTRRAALQIFEGKDLQRKEGDVPCTCTLQFLVRDEALHLVVYMRSNDAVKGLTHDIFCFTMFQELVARSIGLKLGRYYHIAGSLHLYSHDQSKVKEFLEEGFQSTKNPMPAMPDGDPWEAVAFFREIEATIRTGRDVPESSWNSMPKYWQDLAQILQLYFARRNNDSDRIAELSRALENTVYSAFLSSRLRPR